MQVPHEEGTCCGGGYRSSYNKGGSTRHSDGIGGSSRQSLCGSIRRWYAIAGADHPEREYRRDRQSDSDGWIASIPEPTNIGANSTAASAWPKKQELLKREGTIPFRSGQIPTVRVNRDDHTPPSSQHHQAHGIVGGGDGGSSKARHVIRNLSRAMLNLSILSTSLPPAGGCEDVRHTWSHDHHPDPALLETERRNRETVGRKERQPP